METPDRMWVVQPQYPLVRRILFPIYGRDQLIFFAVFALLVIVGATFDRKLALYMGVGGYVGAMLVMEISTPSFLLLPAACEERVVQILDDAQSLRRTGNGREWINARGRLYRWDSDTIRLELVPNGVLVTGGHRDLLILAEAVRA